MNEYVSSPPDIAPQSDYIVLQISQRNIKDRDTEYVTLLHGATGTIQSFEAAFQRYVLFLISGYDDDPRELYQIPEVVRFIKDPNNKLPLQVWAHQILLETTVFPLVSRDV